MITRRGLLKLALAGGGYVALGPGGTLRRVSTAFASTPASPRLTPFVQELPLPGPPSEVVGGFAPQIPAEFGDFRRFIVPGRTRFFELLAEERFVKLHPDLPATNIWGYRDVNDPTYDLAAGPTFIARFNEGLGFGRLVRLHNRLPATDSIGLGDPRLTMHFHGGHHPFFSDGIPADLSDFTTPFRVPPGGSFDYLYPALDQDFDSTPSRDERPSTLWYHDHAIDFTAVNVYRGLAGFTLAQDEIDTLDELTGLQLPANQQGGFPTKQPHDIPLVIQDRLIDRDGQLVYDSMSHNGFLGDTYLVNGAVQPFLHVSRRKYRFRFLNGSNARIYQIFLTNAAGQVFSFDQIATEGGLLSRPIRGLRSFFLSMAERVEIVIDFSKFKKGDALFFENRMQQTDGRKPDGVVGSGPRLMKLIVGDPEDDPSVVPDTLRPFAKASATDIANAVHRTFEFDRRHGMWAINGELAGDLDTSRAMPVDGQPEIWHIVNKSGGWAHPIHVHSEFGRVLLRNGSTPPLQEQDGIARKDTVYLGPNEDAHVFFKFRDFNGPFVFHCHNLEHEDMAMMARFDVVPK